MASINQVQLIGNTGKDPEVRVFEGGTKIASLTLATTERYTDRNGQQQEATEWHNLVFNGKIADVVEKYVKKGMLIFVGGKIKYRSWQDQNGQRRFQTEILCNAIQILEKPQEAQAPAPAPAPAPTYQAPPQGYGQAPAPQYQPAPPYPPQPGQAPVPGDLPF